MNAPTATVLRGASAINEVRDLLDQLARVDELAMRCTSSDHETDTSGEGLVGTIDITPDEVREVIARRRYLITNRLENIGLRIAPDPFLEKQSDES